MKDQLDTSIEMIDNLWKSLETFQSSLDTLEANPEKLYMVFLKTKHFSAPWNLWKAMETIGNPSFIRYETLFLWFSRFKHNGKFAKFSPWLRQMAITLKKANGHKNTHENRKCLVEI